MIKLWIMVVLPEINPAFSSNTNMAMDGLAEQTGMLKMEERQKREESHLY